LKPLLEQLVQESADYARRAQSVTAARTNAALSLVTLVGLPITISAGLVPLVRVQGFLGVAIMVALAASLSALLLMTGVGRGFLRSLRDPK
jgi:hypothetical protein